MANYKVGDMVEGTVSGIQNYGVFVDLEDGYNGLIHISEISKKFVKNINDYVNIGEKINVKIVEINEENSKCKLSIKDINYIKVDKNNNIKEVGTGFDNLRESLDNWIEEKKAEIFEEKNKKN